MPAGGASAAILTQAAFDLKPFEDIKFTLLVKPGDTIKIGQPIAEDKMVPGRMFCSPAGGVIAELRRGLKRCLLDVVIDVSAYEEHHQSKPVKIDEASPQPIMWVKPTDFRLKKEKKMGKSQQ